MSEIQKQLQDVTELISLPEVYLKVRRLIEDPNADIYDFAEAIGVDPNLSARVLKVVNSAYFGFPEPVDSLARAINMIGIGPLHNMVLGISAMSSLKLPNDVMPLNTFWRASLFAGVLARLLAERMKIGKTEHLFLAGLLHDIGHLVLYSKFPLQVLAAQRLADEQGQEIYKAELQVLGYHYGDIGAMLMANWNLPENLQNLTRTHTSPLEFSEPNIEAVLVNLAHACGEQFALDEEADADNTLNSAVWSFTGLTPMDLWNSLDEARAVSADLEKVILE